MWGTGRSIRVLDLIQANDKLFNVIFKISCRVYWGVSAVGSAFPSHASMTKFLGKVMSSTLIHSIPFLFLREAFLSQRFCVAATQWIVFCTFFDPDCASSVSLNMSLPIVSDRLEDSILQ